MQIVFSRSNCIYVIGRTVEMEEQVKIVEELVKKIVSQSEDLVPKMEDVKAEEIGDMVEKEMQETTNAIEKAAKRIEVCFSLIPENTFLKSST